MTDAETSNASQQAYWNDAAGRVWSDLQDLLDRQLEPVGEAAIRALAPRTGERLLDIGCGTGQTSLDLASRVGPAGGVLGVDISRPMLQIARSRAAKVAQVRFEEADAQTFPFAPGTFDGAFSRFGVMFFADPVAAFSNIRSALKPGGRLAFVCWRAVDENPWMTPSTGDVLADAPPTPRPEPGAPGPFGFADPERVRRILADAGFADLDVARHDVKIGGNSLDDTIALSLNVGPLGALLRERPERRDAVISELRKTLSPHLHDGKVLQAGATWIVTARNP